METPRTACLLAADMLAEVVEQALDTDLIRLCIGGLHDFASKYDTYASTAITSAQFLKELTEKVKEIAESEAAMALRNDIAEPFAQKTSDHTNKTLWSIHMNAPIDICCSHDDAFSLVESMAVIIREVHLRQGAGEMSPIHQSIMRFFEESGYWQADESSLIVDYYYRRIPIAVLHDLTVIQPSEHNTPSYLT